MKALMGCKALPVTECAALPINVLTSMLPPPFMLTCALQFDTTTSPLLFQQQAYVVAVSPARTTSTDPKEYVAWGHSSAVSPWGEIIVEASGEHQGQQILMVDMDLAKVDEFRTNVPTALQKRPDVYSFGAAK